MWTLLALSFLIGMRHALEADHVAAVASLATRAQTPRQTLRLGMAWGLGHSLTLFAFGSLVLLTDTVVPAKMAQMLELAVGIMLVILGVDVVRRLIQERIHFHAHRHPDGIRHFHAHSHTARTRHDPNHHEHAHGASLPLRALIVGLVHGMAGSAALVLLTLETIHSVAVGLIYIGLFGVGSLAGMFVLSAIITLPLRYAATRLNLMFFALQGAVGLGTVVLGIQVIYSIVSP